VDAYKMALAHEGRAAAGMVAAAPDLAAAGFAASITSGSCAELGTEQARWRGVRFVTRNV